MRYTIVKNENGEYITKEEKQEGQIAYLLGEDGNGIDLVAIEKYKNKLNSKKNLTKTAS